METVTYTSHDARLKWRDMMDAALTGKRVLIKRYGTPQAVLVNYEQWSMFEDAFLNMLKERSQEVKAGNFVPFEEVEEDLKAQGVIP